MPSTRNATKPRGPSVEEALRELLKLLPQVVHGIKRAGGPAPPALRELFASSALAPRHIPALGVIALDGPLSVTALAARLDVTLTTASLMVSELARTGLVERREDERDRRRTIVSVAEEYRADVDEWLAQRAEPMRRALESLSASDRAVFLDALRLLEAKLRAAEAPAG